MKRVPPPRNPLAVYREKGMMMGHGMRGGRATAAGKEQMKILQLDIEGFRSLKKVSWRPGDLNVVIGPNGSGKSNLLRVLELVSVAAQGGLAKHVQRSGGMDALVWDGKAEEIALGVVTSSVREAPPTSELVYTLNLARLGDTSAYTIPSESLLPASDLGNGRAKLEYMCRAGTAGRINDRLDKARGKIRIHDKVEVVEIKEDQALLALAGSPATGVDTVLRFCQQLCGWSIYNDVRVDQRAAVRQAVVTRMEKRVDADGQNLINVLHTLYAGDRGFKQEINAAMRAAFGDDFDELIFPPAADQRVQLRVRWKTLSREQSAADLSDGTLRFLFLLAVLANPSPSPLIAIDEPETGLHPTMQAIVAEYAVEASKRAQIILTTHSAQFLDAFHDTKPTTTVAKWVKGETILTTLEGGTLKQWLKEYSLGTLYRSGELEDME